MGASPPTRRILCATHLPYAVPSKRGSTDDYAVDSAMPGSGGKLSELVSGATGKLSVKVAQGALRTPAAASAVPLPKAATTEQPPVVAPPRPRRGSALEW